VSIRVEHVPPALRCTDCGRAIAGVIYFPGRTHSSPLCERCCRARIEAQWDDDRAHRREDFGENIGAFDRDAPRNRLPSARPCETCARPVAFQRRRRARTTFCSHACEREARNAPRRVVHEERVCKRERCANVFTPGRSDQEYCSGACKQRAYRKRKREAGSPA
jgi:hypothetical protein